MRKAAIGAVVMLFMGCGASLQQLKTRAALDFDCEAETILLKSVDQATEVASGCGKRAIYVQQFNNNRYSTWLLNSEVKNQESASR